MAEKLHRFGLAIVVGCVAIDRSLEVLTGHMVYISFRTGMNGPLLVDYEQRIREALPKIYSYELLNNLFRHPYTKIEAVQEDLGVSRFTATPPSPFPARPRHASAHA